MGKEQAEPGDSHWPFEEFNRFLEECMEAATIKNRAELSRLTGISETQFSKWLYGAYRPSTRLLDVLAGALDVPTEDLMFKAGYRVRRSGDAITAPPGRVEEYVRLERLDKQLEAADQAALRAVIAAIVDRYAARLGPPGPGRT
jgi:transcriptional regulator with XRE-family HTH domain